MCNVIMGLGKYQQILRLNKYYVFDVAILLNIFSRNSHATKCGSSSKKYRFTFGVYKKKLLKASNTKISRSIGRKYCIF